MAKPKVVVLGAGYAGLRALHVLKKNKNDVDIILVDRNDYHYEATNLHEVAAGSVSANKISYPIRDVAKEGEVTFIQDSVKKIDLAEKAVQLEKQKITYDYLIVALGFVSESFGIKGVDEYSLPMATVDDAQKIREHIHTQMKKYQETKEQDLLNIIVCGAGFTGVELMGALCDERSELAKLAGVQPEEINLYCVEAATRLLPMFDEKLSTYGVNLLLKRGVKLLTGKKIVEITDGAVMAESEGSAPERISGGTIIWTTGVSGSRVVGESGFAEKRGRVMVQQDLSYEGHPEVFVVGDCSAVMDPKTERPYPGTAQISLKMGEAAGKNVMNLVNARATEPFSFTSLGTVCSVGNTKAFGLVGSMGIKGYPASVAKKAIVDKSLLATGGLKEMFAKGRFDFYH